MITTNELAERIRGLVSLLWEDKTPDDRLRDIIKEIRILRKVYNETISVEIR